MNRHQIYDKYKRNQESRTFYKSKAWEICRQLVLMRDHYLCQDCLKNKQITPADMVHHIKELVDHPELGLSTDNLVSLCNSCHNMRHSIQAERKQKLKNKIKVVKAAKNPEVV